MQNTPNYRAGLYCRLSKDDEQRGESLSNSDWMAAINPLRYRGYHYDTEIEVSNGNLAFHHKHCNPQSKISQECY